MTEPDRRRAQGGSLSRRTLVGAIGAGATVAGSRRVLADAEKGIPPSVVTSPPRQFGPNAPPNVYGFDPDIVTVDPLFAQYVQGNTPIQRLWTGALWCEGPAWNGQGRYLVWSDIPNNRQLRWLEENSQVSVFRAPSNNSNGNTFDFQGRQLSCEHLTRRVVRYEHDGSVTVIADSFNGKRLNSPNDVVPHPDGSIWFTTHLMAASFTKASPT
jgi:gluconolactonase